MHEKASCMPEWYGWSELIWLNKTARITLVLPRAEPSKSQARVHQKFGVIPLIFNEMRELHFLHGFARDVDVWSPCMPVAPDEKRLVFLTVTPQKCSFFLHRLVGNDG